MRRMAVAALAGMLVSSPTVAQAPDKPVLAPTKDVTVTYRMTGNQPGGTAVMRITYADHNRKVRVDRYAFVGATTPFDSIIFDQPADHVLSLFRAQNAYFEVPAAGRANPGLMLGNSMQYTRQGTATVAGQLCTDWHVTDAGLDKGTACVSADGIVLRATRARPLTGGIEALAVEYGTPPASTFQPDPGLQLQQVAPPADLPPGPPSRSR